MNKTRMDVCQKFHVKIFSKGLRSILLKEAEKSSNPNTDVCCLKSVISNINI